MQNTIIVTRHKALVEFLKELGRIEGDEPVIEHVTAADVAGKHVIGVLPLHLAAVTASVTEVSLDVPKELRGGELTLEQLRKFATYLRSFEVTCLGEEELLPF